MTDVFAGVAQADMENAPSAEVILEARLPEVPDKIPVYRIEK